MPKTLLLVEDEAIIALSEASMLKKNGFEVITVHDAPAAIEAVRGNAVDLVLMDIDLGWGKMCGTEAAERILEERELPIVFLTSHSEKEMVDKVKGITRYGYVLKNAGEFVLLESITMAFELFKSYLEIKKKEQQLHLLVDNIDDIVYSVDAETEEFEYLSPAFTRMLGYTREDILEMGGRKKFLGTVILKGAFEEQLKALEEHQNSLRGRLRHIAAWKTKAGSEIIIEDNWVAQYEEGVLVKTEGVLRDITGRMHIHEKLQKSEALYRNLMENSIDAIYLLDRSGKILNVNQVACDMTGYSRKELLRLTIDDIDPNYPSENFIEFWNAQPEGTTLLFETVHRNKDGTFRPVEVNGIFFILYGKKYLFGVARDITGRRRTGEPPDESRNRFRLMLEKLPVPIIISCGAEEEVLSVNQKFQKVFGYTLQDIPDIYHWWRKAYPDESYRRKISTDWGANLKRAQAENRELDPAEVYITCKDGTVRYAEVRGYSLGDVHMIVFTDLTEINSARTELENSLKEKDFLMKEINHRVKNNLMMISSLIQLKDSALGEMVDLSDLAHQVDAVQIVHDKLFQSDDVTRISMPDYITDLLSTVFSFIKRPVKIESTIAEESLPSRQAVSLGLMINEIATNAVKHGFTEETSARFSVDFRTDPQRLQYTLTISNNGKPFPKETDLDNPKTMGLRLISALVEQLEGTIELRRTPETVFTIRFPAV